VFLITCAACATTRPASPFFGDEQYLRFGVDPRDEANTLVKSYAEKSERLALRIMGQHFTAISFIDRSGRATRTRVVTARGIALALDPGPLPLEPTLRYALLGNPIPNTQDADGDGFEEVFVEQRSRRETCLAVYRVRDVGFVDPVPVNFSLFGAERCPNTVMDIDHDGRAELLADVPLLDFELAAPPMLRVALWANRHRYVLRDENGRQANYVAQQEAEHERALEEARAAHDTQASLRLAVELAALARLLDRPTADQLSRFDDALAGLGLAPRDKARAAQARAQIAADWAPSQDLVVAPPEAAAPLAQRDASWYTSPPHEQEGQERVERRADHLPQPKGRAELRRRGAPRSRDRTHRVRSQKSARKARGSGGRVRIPRKHGTVSISDAHRPL
jgi:hypothetical protein